MFGRKRVTIYTNAPYLENIGTKLDPMRRQPSMHFQLVLELCGQMG